MARILISAGEASGDLYAGAVTRGIKQLNPEAEVFGMGGDCLREAGGEVLFDIKDHSLMGFVEVLKKLPDVWKLRNAFIDLMEKRKPDVLLT
ncbi:MAG: lipid-A-disaccharide synthase, partial [Acidaminococcaceae bacterium]|nr:lipid-A-disaccharide synthase [Acidaminococcaceae bacterium]